MTWTVRILVAATATALLAGCGTGSTGTAQQQPQPQASATAGASDEPSEGATAASSEVAEVSETPEPTESPTPTLKEDRAAVRKVWNAFTGALVGYKGDVAADLLASQTLSYYDEIQYAAAYWGPKDIKQRPVSDRLTIAMLRATMSDKAVARLDEKELYARGVEEGWLEGKSVAAEELGRIDVSGRLAYARVIRDGKRLPVKYEFVREDDGWRINPITAYGDANYALEQLIKKEGVTENEFIFVVVKQVTGRPIGPEIFSKPKNVDPDDHAEGDA